MVEEEKDESIENVLSDIDYDVSGEEVLKDTSQMVRLKRTSNDESKFPPAKKSRDNLENAEITAIEVNDKQNDEKSKVDVNFYNQADKVGDIKKSESKSSINSFISSRKMLTTRKHNFVQSASIQIVLDAANVELAVTITVKLDYPYPVYLMWPKTKLVKVKDVL